MMDRVRTIQLARGRALNGRIDVLINIAPSSTFQEKMAGVRAADAPLLCRKNTPGSYSADRLAGGHSNFSLLRLWSKCGEGPVEIADVEQAVRNRGRSIKDGAFGVILILEEYSSVCRIQHEEGGAGRGHHQPGYSSWRGQHAIGRGEAAFPQIGSC